MKEKKAHSYTSPDLSTLQEVVIDLRTKIYIPKGDDPEEARSRYLARVSAKKI